MNMKAVGICALVSFIIALIISFGTSIALIFFFAPMNLVNNNNATDMMTNHSGEVDILSFSKIFDITFMQPFRRLK